MCLWSAWWTAWRRWMCSWEWSRVISKNLKETPVARGRVLGGKIGKRAGAALPGASLAPHSWPYPTCHSRDRDYDDIDDDPFNPQARRIAAHNPPRGQLRSFCSYSSGLGSQTSLQPPAQTISNAPVSEYMYGRAPRASPVPPPTHRAGSAGSTFGSREPGGEEASEASARMPCGKAPGEHLVLEEEPLQASGLLPQACRAG